LHPLSPLPYLLFLAVCDSALHRVHFNPGVVCCYLESPLRNIPPPYPADSTHIPFPPSMSGCRNLGGGGGRVSFTVCLTCCRLHSEFPLCRTWGMRYSQGWRTTGAWLRRRHMRKHRQLHTSSTCRACKACRAWTSRSIHIPPPYSCIQISMLARGYVPTWL